MSSGAILVFAVLAFTACTQELLSRFLNAFLICLLIVASAVPAREPPLKWCFMLLMSVLPVLQASGRSAVLAAAMIHGLDLQSAWYVVVPCVLCEDASKSFT